MKNTVTKSKNTQPHRHYTVRELQTKLGFNERTSLRRLRRNGWMIDPDIQVGDRYGSASRLAG